MPTLVIRTNENNTVPVVDVVVERLASYAATAFCSAAVASVVVACHHLHLASYAAVGPEPAFQDSYLPCSKQKGNIFLNLNCQKCKIKLYCHVIPRYTFEHVMLM